MYLISKVDGNRAELPQGFYDLRHILHFRLHERKQTGITDITIIQSKVGGGTHGHVDQVYQTQFGILAVVEIKSGPMHVHLSRRLKQQCHRQ